MMRPTCVCVCAARQRIDTGVGDNLSDGPRPWEWLDAYANATNPDVTDTVATVRTQLAKGFVKVDTNIYKCTSKDCNMQFGPTTKNTKTKGTTTPPGKLFRTHREFKCLDPRSECQIQKQKKRHERELNPTGYFETSLGTTIRPDGCMVEVMFWSAEPELFIRGGHAIRSGH